MDPYGQPQPSDFFLDLQHQQSPSIPQPSTGPRQYKSRKFRPCDFCRARQVACKIETSPPCTLCASHSRDCTFVEQPKKKRRPNPGGSANSTTPVHTRHQSLSHVPNGSNIHESHNQLASIDPALSAFDHDSHTSLQLDESYLPHFNHNVFDPQLLQDNPFLDPQIQDFSQSPTQTHYSQISPIYERTQSFSGQDGRQLDYQANASARFIGETGELNPYLLRNYNYDENDEATISKIGYRRFPKRKASDQSSMPPPVFMLVEDVMNVKGEPRLEDNALLQAEQTLANMVSEEEGLRLVGLFFQFVNPYYQILPRARTLINGMVSMEAVRAWPLSLRASVYATALPFILYDAFLSTSTIHNPPSAIHLYRLAWQSIQHELHTPRMTTLQACLLLLQRAPTNRYTTDTPFKSALLGWTVSLAQALGLHSDPSTWTSIPAWELTLRKRLWHAVYIIDKWISLGAGTPSHINSSGFDVSALTPLDCEDLPSMDATEDESRVHFRLLSSLTSILSDIMDSYYTLSASKATSNDFPHSLDLAWPLRSRLKAWNDSLPASLSLRRSEAVDSRGLVKLSGNPSLSLAYIVATMTLYKALMRPLLNSSDSDGAKVLEKGIEGSVEAAKEGARACAREVVEFVEGLGRGALEGFWHSFSRSNFAIASSFLMQLHISATSPSEKEEIGGLVNRWRWAMRIGSGTMGNGLMSLGLLRMDGLLLEDQKGQDSNEGRRATIG